MWLNSKKVPIEFSGNPTKFKKYHKIKNKSSMKTCSTLLGGHPLAYSNITFMSVKQLTTVNKLIKPSMKKIGKSCVANISLWPNILLTKKPKDIRMGRGKGAPTERVSVAGTKLFCSISNIKDKEAQKLYKICTPKLHKSKYVKITKW